jgi:putative nucleotidyltransferase with HDIG domain
MGGFYVMNNVAEGKQMTLNTHPGTSYKGKLLVVDDDEHILGLLARILEDSGYEIITSQDADEALEALNNSNFDLALLDIQMPGENGITLLGKIVERYPDIAIIMISGIGEIESAVTTIKMGAYDFVSKPFDISTVESRVTQALEKRKLLIENRNYHLNLELMVEERTLELKLALGEINHTYDETIKVLGAALDLRDSETEFHCKRVAAFVLKLARAYGIEDKKHLKNIERGAYLHDIGKIGIPDAILLKPAKLTTEEREQIKTHSEMGYRLIKKIQFLEGAAELVFAHHEFYDGTGYPQGLKGKEIPISARLFSVADTLDAMMSDRPYRKALTLDAVGIELQKLSGIQFDPQVVNIFFSIPNTEWRF